MSDFAVHNVYCQRTDQIVPLEGRFCRSCSSQLDEEDRSHTEVTPEVLDHMGYVSTSLPEEKLRGVTDGYTLAGRHVRAVPFSRLD